MWLATKPPRLASDLDAKFGGFLLRAVRCLAFDLDNTLYDWVPVWAGPFRAVFDPLCQRLDIRPADLARELQSINAAKGTVEYAFCFDESSLVREKLGGVQLRREFASEFRQASWLRDSAISLYPGVYQGFSALREAGVALVACTDAQSFYASFRLRQLGLDGVVDFVCTPAEHDIPAFVDVERARSRSPSAYRLHETLVVELPRGHRKPSSGMLKDVAVRLNIGTDEMVYVGDSLGKDVAMANAAGVFAVHAAYGRMEDNADYQLLTMVSHRGRDEIEQERTAAARARPDLVAESFADVVSACLDRQLSIGPGV